MWTALKHVGIITGESVVNATWVNVISYDLGGNVEKWRKDSKQYRFMFDRDIAIVGCVMPQTLSICRDHCFPKNPRMTQLAREHDDVIKLKHFPRYWAFVRGIHWSPVNSPHKGQWRRAVMFSLNCSWTKGWMKHRDAGDETHSLWRHVMGREYIKNILWVWYLTKVLPWSFLCCEQYSVISHYDVLKEYFIWL